MASTPAHQQFPFLNSLLRPLWQGFISCFTGPPSPQRSTSTYPPKLHSKTSSAGASTTDTAIPSPANTLASILKGQTLLLPNLRTTFSGWPCATNKHLAQLESFVDATLERAITDPIKLKGLKKANFAHLIALWYPDADLPELELATRYAIWVFVWDDEVDAGESDISTSESKALAYGRESRDYLRLALSLDDKYPEDENKATTATYQNMLLFGDVAGNFRMTMDTAQRQRLYHELEKFMLNAGNEHMDRLRGVIPSVEEYIEVRCGSVGAAPTLAMADRMLKIRLPETIMNSSAMKSLWHQSVIICLILNDIYSVQKEIVQDSLWNIVPVIFHNSTQGGQNLDHVTNEVLRLLENAMQEFESAAKELDEMTATNGESSADMKAYVESCQYFITGVLEWSLTSKRYGMEKCMREDGSLSIVL